MHPKKSRLAQIQNGPLSANIYFKLFYIWKTVLDNWTIPLKQNVKSERRMYSKKIEYDKIQNGRLSAIINLNMPYMNEILLMRLNPRCPELRGAAKPNQARYHCPFAVPIRRSSMPGHKRI